MARARGNRRGIFGNADERGWTLICVYLRSSAAKISSARLNK